MLSSRTIGTIRSMGFSPYCSKGQDAIASGLKELEQHGYLIRRKIRDRNGRFTDVEYVIFELPRVRP